MPALKVEEALKVDDELVAAFEQLIPQLSKSNPPPDRRALQALVEAPNSRVLLVRMATDGEERGAIVGTLTVVLFRIPTGMRARIEDVVVDEAARGTGAVDKLLHAAFDLCKAEGAAHVDLTSNPGRVAGNKVYQRVGFEQRDTNVYRYEL